MTAISPTRISVYDFLIEDTAPINPIIADGGHISIPQANILRYYSIQAIVSALLTYEQKYGANSVLKKLFKRQAVKELRKYNAFNFNTMASALRYNTTVEVLFRNKKTLDLVCELLADIADTSIDKTRTVLSALSLIAIRELAILADFAHLDDADLCKWFDYQYQFMQLDRSQAISTDDMAHQQTATIDIATTPSSTIPLVNVLDNFDTKWYEIVGYQIPQSKAAPTDSAQTNTMPNYAKAIGLAPQSTTGATSISTDDGLVTTTTDEANHHNNAITFANLANISLPHSRWLLQLGQIADIYLSRNRLKIAPEPMSPPPRPLLNLSLSTTQAEGDSESDNDSPITYDMPVPIWKDKTIYITLAVIGVLGLLSVLKFQYRTLPSGKPSTTISASSTSTHQPTYDIAVMRVKDDEITDTNTTKSAKSVSATITERDTTEGSDTLADNELEGSDIDDNLLVDATNSNDGVHDGKDDPDLNTDTLDIITTTHINLISPADKPTSSAPQNTAVDRRTEAQSTNANTTSASDNGLDSSLVDNSNLVDNSLDSSTDNNKADPLNQQQTQSIQAITNDNSTDTQNDKTASEALTTPSSSTTPVTTTANNSQNTQEPANESDHVINTNKTASDQSATNEPVDDTPTADAIIDAEAKANDTTLAQPTLTDTKPSKITQADAKVSTNASNTNTNEAIKDTDTTTKIKSQQSNDDRDIVDSE